MARLKLGPRSRFHAVIDADELRPLLRSEIEPLLLDVAAQALQGSQALRRALDQRAGPGCLRPPCSSRAPKIIPPPDSQAALTDPGRAAGPPGARSRTGCRPSSAALGRGGSAQARQLLDAKHRPGDAARWKRVLVLQILDASWIGTPPRDGSPAELESATRGYCPGRPQGRVQTRRNEDLRRDVDTASATR